MQVVELLIAAAVAAVVLTQLYSVLGRRVGRQPEEAREGERSNVRPNRVLSRAEEAKPTASPTGLAALKAKEPAFEIEKFLDGARSAHQLIVKAYADGDTARLSGLTTPTVLQAFERGIAQRAAEERSYQVEFLSETRADIESISVAGDMARIRVRFLSELRSRTKDVKGEAVDDHRTAEVWTFERSTPSRDPNWVLSRVEAAEA